LLSDVYVFVFNKTMYGTVNLIVRDPSELIDWL
jgi:hypothetical protein